MVGSLDLKNHIFSTKFKIDAQNIYLKNKNRVILNNDNLSIESDIYFNTISEKIHTKDTRLNINGLDLDIKGDLYLSATDSLFANIKILGNDVPIHFLGGFLPKAYQKHLKNADSKGNLNIVALCKGPIYIVKNIFPSYSLKANISNARLKLTEFAAPIEDINLNIECFNDANNTNFHNIKSCLSQKNQTSTELVVSKCLYQ